MSLFGGPGSRERSLLGDVREEITLARAEIRQGRFRRSMAVMTVFAALVSGFEALMQHRKSSFYNRTMWTPILLIPSVMVAGVASLFKERAVKAYLPVSSAVALLTGFVGFPLHLRGIARMPGGLRDAHYNVIMGPPVFAPLLISVVGVLGLLASWLRPERIEDLELPGMRGPDLPSMALRRAGGVAQTVGREIGLIPERRGLPSAVAHGRFQRSLALTTVFLGGLAGGEAYLGHMRGSYNRRWMWLPVWMTPPAAVAGLASLPSAAIARVLLPVTSLANLLTGLLGFWLHLSGLRRMPGGHRNLSFNISKGPPLFAPLLFSAVGLLGLIASIVKRRT